MVGMTGFEPATPSSQARCATKLRYIPMRFVFKLHSFGRSLVFNFYTARRNYVSDLAYLHSHDIQSCSRSPCYIPMRFIFKLHSFGRSLVFNFYTARRNYVSGLAYLHSHDIQSCSRSPCYIPMRFVTAYYFINHNLFNFR